MKRIDSSDSLGALMSMCPVTDEQSSRNNHHVYGRDFRSMFDGLDEEACEEETGHVSEKKRRLSVHQVKALEKNFEVENKLEPERKAKLAQELGLQPRQVAVWFQNRRARWKTKQLERDYGVLKANYDALKHNFESVQRDNEALMREIKELKSKLDEENTESNVSVKEEAMVFESEDGKHMVVPTATATPTMAGSDPDFNCNSFKAQTSSDSDSSAILNEGNSPNAANSSSAGFLQNHHQLLMISSSPTSSSFRFNCSSFPSQPSSINCITLSVVGGDSQKQQVSAAAADHQSQLVKCEEHDFYSGEEACNFFSEEQAPSLQYWGCPDQWT